MKNIFRLLAILFAVASWTTTLYSDNNSINGHCPGEIIEEIDGANTDASHTENGAIGGGGNDRYRMQFNTAGTLDIHARNRDASRNARYDFYVSKNHCGDNDSDWNIVSAEYGRSHSTTVNVQAGDTIYIRLQSDSDEPHNGQQRYALALNFTATSATHWIKNGDNTEAHTDPSPYTNDVDITETLTIPGADQLDVTISGETETNYDYLYITDSNGDEQTFDGSLSQTFTVKGPSITIRFTSDGSVTRDGVQVSIVEHPTSPPILSPIPDQHAVIGNSFSLDLSQYVTLTDSDPITTYHLSCSISGLSFDASTGILSGTPDQNGTSNCTASAEDEDGVSNTQTFKIIVTDEVIEKGIHDFVLINPPSTRNIIGNFATLGNTIECITTSRDHYGASCTDDKNYNDNNYMAKYIDIDNDPATWNSSSSNFTLPTSYTNDGDGILWAGLFWQGAVNGRYTGEPQRRASLNGGGGWNYTDITQDQNVSIPNTDANKVWVKIDSDSDYTKVKSKTLYYDTAFGTKGGYYAAFADITSWVKSKNLARGKHTITLANLTTNEGRQRGTGDYGGWSMIVIYKEQGSQAKARNISIYNGYTTIYNGSGIRSVKISGFKLPKYDTVNASFSAFAGEGEWLYGQQSDRYDRMIMSRFADLSSPDTMPGAVDPDNIFDAILANIDRDNIGDNKQDGNNNGIDVENYDVSPIMTAYRDADQNISAVYIGLSSSQDYVTPSMMAFSAELYMPKICYDYDLRVGEYIKIRPTNKEQREFTADKWGALPLQVKTMIQSKEADFNLDDAKLRVDFTPASFSYRAGESKVSPNSINAYIPTDDTDGGHGQIAIGEHPTSHGGVIGAKENTYAKLFYDFDTNHFAGSFDVTVDANITFVPGEPPASYTFSTAVPLGSPGYITPCASNPVYDPIWGAFNVENDSHASDMKDRLPLHTQITGKPYRVSFASYTKDGNGQFTIPYPSNATVEFDLIDASTYENNASTGFDVTCQEPQPIMRGGFVHFNGNSQVFVNPTDQATYPNYDDSIALHNTAFRIWTLTKLAPNKSDRVIVVHQCNSADDAACFDQVYEDNYKNADDNVTRFCTADCSGSSGSTCYDCLRKYFAMPLCSRDNFAIRPEGFRVVLNDTHEEDASFPANELVINDGDAVSPSAEANLSAGYRYQLKVEATSLGNTGEYNDPGKRSQAYYNRFDTNQTVNPLPLDIKKTGNVVLLDFNDSAACFDRNNTAFNLMMIDGVTPDNAPTFLHSNAGRYALSIIDANWTRVDQGTYRYKTIFDSDCQTDPTLDKCSDCILKSMTSHRNPDEKLGCTIGSSIPENVNYADINLSFQPYNFDVGSVALELRPATTNGFLFMNNFDGNQTKNPYYDDLLVQEIDMAAIYHGSVIARAKGGAQLTNFTDSCAASDVRINLGMDDFNGTMQEYLQHTQSTNPISDKKESINNQPVDLTLPKVAFVDANQSGFIPPPDTNGSDANDTNRSYGPGSAKLWVYTTLKKPTKGQLPAGQDGANPKRIRYIDLNATGDQEHSMADMGTHVPKGSQGYDTNATFLFARITPEHRYYPDVEESYKRTPLYVNVYCVDSSDVNCSNLGITSAGKGQNDSNNWHLADMFASPSDIGMTDMNASTSEGIDADPGVAAQSIPKNTVIQGVTFDTPDTAQQVDINVSVGGPGRPSVVKVFYNPHSPWLLYGDANQSFYRVKFIGHRNWSGVGKTGKVTDTTSSTTTQHRMNW